MHIRVSGTSGDSSPAGVGFWSPCSPTITPTQLATFSDDVLNAWADSILADQGHDSTLTECSVIAYVGSLELTGSTTTTAAFGGTSGTSLPANCCALIHYSTPSTWRGGKPRTYVWGVPTSAADSDGRTLGNAYRAALLSEAESFFSTVNALTPDGVDVSLAALRRVDGGVGLTPGFLVSQTPVEIRNRICTQRRRLGQSIS